VKFVISDMRSDVTSVNDVDSMVADTSSLFFGDNDFGLGALETFFIHFRMDFLINFTCMTSIEQKDASQLVPLGVHLSMLNLCLNGEIEYSM